MYKEYSVIYADPPWHYVDSASAGDRGAEYKYPVMTDDDIANLGVEHIAADDSALFLWVTKPKIDIGLWVLRRWGFTYKTFAFDWTKLTLDGRPKMGMGNWTRANAEHVLLGIKGRPKRASASVMSVVSAIPGKHSSKPVEVRERIEELMGDVPRIELFAREKAPGWDALGLDIGTGDIRENLPRNPNKITY